MRLVPATATCERYAGETKPISSVKPAHVGCCSSNVTVEEHILSTVGDVLSKDM